MVNIRRITSSNDPILATFPELYESSFPEDERVESQKMISLIEKCPQMEFNSIVEDLEEDASEACDNNEPTKASEDTQASDTAETWNVSRASKASEASNNNDRTSLLGIAVIWNLPSCRYLLYLAMRQDKRNQHYGSQVLEYLLRQSDLPIIGEVERPLNEMNRRRIEFYKRNGFHIELEDPKILNENHHHPTCILELISSEPLEDADLCQREVVDVVYRALTQ